jgi:hypothetical protein
MITGRHPPVGVELPERSADRTTRARSSRRVREQPSGGVPRTAGGPV